MTQIPIIDLFCGAGGLTHGFVKRKHAVRFKPVLAMDHDRAAIETYNRNFGNHGVVADIEAWLAANDVPRADVVLGGPPCQGFSLLNRKRQGDERRALWEPYMDIVAMSGARLFVMENVPDLLKSEEFEDIRRRAVALGFRLHAAKLNTADYGVPQVRRRAIVIGVRMGEVHFPPPPTHGREGEGLPTWLTVRGAIANLPEPVGTEIRAEAAPYDLHFGRNPTEVSRIRYSLIPEGGNRFDLQRKAPQLTPPCWLRKKSGGTDLFGRLWWDRPSVTIRTEFFKPEKGRYLHPSSNRPITHREAARLMGFPDSFVFVGSKTQVARQIGNAVPPPFAASIARVVAAALTSEPAGVC